MSNTRRGPHFELLWHFISVLFGRLRCHTKDNNSQVAL